MADKDDPTNKERQKRFRMKKSAEGKKEVRGVYVKKEKAAEEKRKISSSNSKRIMVRVPK